MKNFLKNYWKTLLFFAVAGLVGGFCTGLFLLDSYPAQIKQQLLGELDAAGLGAFPVDLLLGVVTAFQAAGYGLVLGAAGIFLGKKVGLWRDERTLEKKKLVVTAIAAVVGGALLILPDLLVFGKYSQTVMDSYAAKPTAVYILGCVVYGGVIEEVMLRLFMMSLAAFLLHKLFGKGQKTPSTAVLVVANVISALLFAAGHLPATVILLGSTPLIIFRCFLLNGAFGMLFGWLYRKCGLRYAMLAHAGCHVVSKLIWIFFI